MRIMPGHLTQSNLILLEESNSESTLSQYYSSNAKSLVSSDANSDYNYFQFSNSKNYFPKLVFTDEYLPFGTSSMFCLHLSWIKKD